MKTHLFHKLKQWASSGPPRDGSKWDWAAKTVLMMKAGYHLAKIILLLCAV